MEAKTKSMAAVPSSLGKAPRKEWWNIPQVKRHVNKMICGVGLNGITEGDIVRLKSANSDRPFARGVSIECGSGEKELTLLERNIVEHFDIYEVSDIRVQRVRMEVERRDLSSRVRFFNKVEDFLNSREKYELVYWNNSLHRRKDVKAALRWSSDVLSDEGVVYVNGYIGPNRHQWSGPELSAIRQARRALPKHLLVRPDGGRLPVDIEPHSVERWMAMDPSEAIDSASILPTFKSLFPTAEVRQLGGLLYFVALRDLFGNFDDERDGATLDAVLFADEVLSAAGHSFYASMLHKKTKSAAAAPSKFFERVRR